MTKRLVGAVGTSTAACPSRGGRVFASTAPGVPGMLDSSEVQVLCPGLVETKG